MVATGLFQRQGRPALRAFRDCRQWHEDARGTTKAGLDRGRGQSRVRLRHGYTVAAVAASCPDRQPRAVPESRPNARSVPRAGLHRASCGGRSGPRSSTSSPSPGCTLTEARRTEAIVHGERPALPPQRSSVSILPRGGRAPGRALARARASPGLPVRRCVPTQPRSSKPASSRSRRRATRDARRSIYRGWGIEVCQAAKGGAASKSAVRRSIPMWRPLRSAIVAASATPSPCRPAPPSGPSGMAIMGGNVS